MKSFQMGTCVAILSLFLGVDVGIAQNTLVRNTALTLESNQEALTWRHSNGPIYQASATDSRQANALDSSNFLAHTHQGIVFLEKEKYEDAEAAFLTALELSPDHPRLYLFLGFSLMAQKEYGEATAALQKSIDLEPTYAISHALLGLTWMAQQDYEAAEMALRKSIELDPSQEWVHQLLSFTLMQQGGHQEVEEAL